MVQTERYFILNSILFDHNSDGELQSPFIINPVTESLYMYSPIGPWEIWVQI